MHRNHPTTQVHAFRMQIALLKTRVSRPNHRNHNRYLWIHGTYPIQWEHSMMELMTASSVLTHCWLEPVILPRLSCLVNLTASRTTHSMRCIISALEAAVIFKMMGLLNPRLIVASLRAPFQLILFLKQALDKIH